MGQGLVEYALIMTVVAIVVIAVLMLLGPQIGNTFDKIQRELATGRNRQASSEAREAVERVEERANEVTEDINEALEILRDSAFDGLEFLREQAEGRNLSSTFGDYVDKANRALKRADMSKR